ncbi:MAG: O-antigen ligase family protein [Novosphingobium sp.]
MIAFNRAKATLAYLVAVLLLGGASAAGFTGNALLQIGGAILVGWSLWESGEGEIAHTGLRRFFLALLVMWAVQFIPLPPGLWQLLPGRGPVYQGFTQLGTQAPWLTLGLAPWHALASIAWWIPAMALFLSMRAPGGPTARHVVWTITAVASVSVAFGSVQVAGGSFYFYDITNLGDGPGFFANANHQGSFLLAALALWGCWAIGEQRAAGPVAAKLASKQSVEGGIALLLTFGVIVSGSLACQLLLVPVLAALVLVAFPDFRLPMPLALLAAVLVIAGFALFLLFGPAANDLTEKGVIPGISRHDFLFTGAKILRDFAPFGSGTGTFVELYRWYEDPAQVNTTFVNHAHDDLLETLIETGVFGLAAIVLFLGWFVRRAWGLWSGSRRNAVQIAASIVIGTELIHSVVDYPLRTAAMSSVMAIACVLMVRPADPPRARGGNKNRSRRSGQTAKHVDMIKI